MLDRLLNYSLHLTIVGLICASGLASLLTGYHGLLQSLHLRPSSVGWIFLAVALGAGSYQLCRHRHELVDG